MASPSNTTKTPSTRDAMFEQIKKIQNKVNDRWITLINAIQELVEQLRYGGIDPGAIEHCKIESRMVAIRADIARFEAAAISVTMGMGVITNDLKTYSADIDRAVETEMGRPASS